MVSLSTTVLYFAFQVRHEWIRKRILDVRPTSPLPQEYVVVRWTLLLTNGDLKSDICCAQIQDGRFPKSADIMKWRHGWLTFPPPTKMCSQIDWPKNLQLAHPVNQKPSYPHTELRYTSRRARSLSMAKRIRWNWWGHRAQSVVCMLSMAMSCHPLLCLRHFLLGTFVVNVISCLSDTASGGRTRVLCVAKDVQNLTTHLPAWKNTLLHINSDTVWGVNLFQRFCDMFSGSSLACLGSITDAVQPSGTYWQGWGVS